MRKIKDRFIDEAFFQKEIENLESNLDTIELVRLENNSVKELNEELMEAWMSVYLELDKSDIYLKTISVIQNQAFELHKHSHHPFRDLFMFLNDLLRGKIVLLCSEFLPRDKEDKYDKDTLNYKFMLEYIKESVDSATYEKIKNEFDIFTEKEEVKFAFEMLKIERVNNYAHFFSAAQKTKNRKSGYGLNAFSQFKYLINVILRFFAKVCNEEKMFSTNIYNYRTQKQVEKLSQLLAIENKIPNEISNEADRLYVNCGFIDR